MKNLSPAEQQQLWADKQKQLSQKLDRFFKLPPKEQTAELNQEIVGMQERAKRWGQGRTGGGESGGNGGPSRGGLGSGEPGKKGESGWKGARPDNPMAWEGNSGRKSSSPEAREQQRKNFLDSTTPHFRAQMTEYRRLLKELMQQRGVSSPFARGPR